MKRRPTNIRLQQHNRRAFLRLATVAAAAFMASCGDDSPTPTPGPPADECVPQRQDGWLRPSDPEVQLPHLGGAPDTRQGASIAAFVDTIVPSAHRDPTGAPGGLDVGAPALFFDPDLPALEFAGALATFLDLTANSLVAGSNFGTLPPERREEAVEKALDLDLMEFAVQLAKLAYFSSEGAACHLGYPGANPGYFDDPDFSFDKSLATEITKDGNFP